MTLISAATVLRNGLKGAPVGVLTDHLLWHFQHLESKKVKAGLSFLPDEVNCLKLTHSIRLCGTKRITQL